MQHGHHRGHVLLVGCCLLSEPGLYRMHFGIELSELLLPFIGKETPPQKRIRLRNTLYNDQMVLVRSGQFGARSHAPP